MKIFINEIKNNKIIIIYYLTQMRLFLAFPSSRNIHKLNTRLVSAFFKFNNKSRPFSLELDFVGMFLFVSFK